MSQPTVRRYLDALTAAGVCRQLPPWFQNISKRQVKSPKVYVCDTGLLHVLLGIRSRADLDGHPKVGASWEGFALEQVIAATGARPDIPHCQPPRLVAVVAVDAGPDRQLGRPGLRDPPASPTCHGALGTS